MNLITNRYGVTTPTLILENGQSVSSPIYINLTTEVKKDLLNRFREIKTQQQIQAGYNPISTSKSGVSVVDNTKAPMTPIEHELGMDEHNLRLALFSRTGLPEVQILKLQEATGVELVTRQMIEQTQKLWLDHLFGNNATKRAKPVKANK